MFNRPPKNGIEAFGDSMDGYWDKVNGNLAAWGRSSAYYSSYESTSRPAGEPVQYSGEGSSFVGWLFIAFLIWLWLV